MKEVIGQIIAGEAPVPRIKIVQYNGKSLHLYSIGWLSYLTKRAVVTLRLWERQKLLPKPIFKLHDSTRWYSAAELLCFNQAITKHYQEGRDKEELKKSLHIEAARLRADYKRMTPQTAEKYTGTYFELPGEQKHEKILIDLTRQNKKAKTTKRQLLATLHETKSQGN